MQSSWTSTSITIDEVTKLTLQEKARRQGISLAQLLRNIASEIQ